MVTIGMNYDVQPGKENLFEEKFHAVLASFAAGSGHVNTRLYRDVATPQSYLIHSEWETREAVQKPVPFRDRNHCHLFTSLVQHIQRGPGIFGVVFQMQTQVTQSVLQLADQEQGFLEVAGA